MLELRQMNSSAKRRSQRRICHLDKLPLVLKNNITIFIVDEKSYSDADKSDLHNLILFFFDCLQRYEKLIDARKLDYYLKLYSSRYCDVYELAYRSGVEVGIFPVDIVRYSVVNINDKKYQHGDHGILSHNNQESKVTFVNAKKFDMPGIYHAKSKFIESFGLSGYNTNHSLVFDVNFIGFRTWDRILFDRQSFPFLSEENVNFNSKDYFLTIKSRLTTLVFRKMINLKEGRNIFSRLD